MPAAVRSAATARVALPATTLASRRWCAQGISRKGSRHRTPHQTCLHGGRWGNAGASRGATAGRVGVGRATAERGEDRARVSLKLTRALPLTSSFCSAFWLQ